MKTKAMLLASLFASSAFAHDDPFLNVTVHELYHGAFWLLVLAIAAKATHWGVQQFKKRSQR